MNNMNIPSDKMDSLLKMAGQKLGQNPNDIKSKLENGDLNNLIGSLDPKTQNKITSLLNNPKAVEALMQSNNVKNLIDGLMGNKN